MTAKQYPRSMAATDSYRSAWDRIWGGGRDGDTPEPESERALNRSFGLPSAAPPKVAAPAADVHAWLDRAMAARIEVNGRPPACAKGCNDCCQQAVGVFAWEADRLAEAVKALPSIETSQEASVRKTTILYQLEVCAERAPAARLDSWPPSDEARLRWRQAGIMCPLNDPDTGACLVWDARPSVCRLYNVVDGPQGVCDVPGGSGMAVPFLDLLTEAGRLNGEDRQWLPLALAARL